jgi:hypothetical protein
MMKDRETPMTGNKPVGDHALIERWVKKVVMAATRAGDAKGCL